MSTILKNLRAAIANRSARNQQNIARRWILNKVKEFGGISSAKLLKDDSLIKETNGRPGYMYFFSYDAKYKDTLPFWDRYPLMILLDITSDGFSGLNIHYLPPIIRAQFLDKLMETSDNKNLTEKTKMNITYNMLKSIGKFKAFAPCYKNYLFSHVRSKMKRIPSYHWKTVSFLPVEQFQKKSKLTVWKNSRKLI